MTRLGDRTRVVLVRPAIPGNLGAAARVMRNFGLSDLRLVRPHADPVDEQARKLSKHGESILTAAKSVEDFADAVHDCVLVVGTSARTGGPFRRQSVVTPREIMPVVAKAASGGSVALVFGPEQTGLTNVEVTRCHYLLHIPADEQYPALNLGQAVAICLYELHVAGLALQSPPTTNNLAPFALQERMFVDLEAALRDLHFLWRDNAESLMHALRHLIGRTQPTRMEADLLLGLARQVRWYVQHYGANEHTPKETTVERSEP